MKQTPIKYGIIAGLATVVYLYAFYLAGARYFLNPLVYWSALIIPVVAMVKATRKTKEMNGGDIDKKMAVRTSFITWILAMVIFQLFMYIMFQQDANLTEILREMMREANGDKAAGEITVLTAGAAFQYFLFMLLPGFLFSYMVASFLKSS